MVNEMIKKRERVSIDEIGSGPIVFLYRNKLGRLLLKIISLPIISKLAGWFMDRKISAIAIKRFIKKNNIMSTDRKLTTTKQR